MPVLRNVVNDGVVEVDDVLAEELLSSSMWEAVGAKTSRRRRSSTEEG